MIEKMRALGWLMIAFWSVGQGVSIAAAACEGAELVPVPVHYEKLPGSVTLGEDTAVVMTKGGDDAESVGRYLIERVKDCTGWQWHMVEGTSPGSQSATIKLAVGGKKDAAAESYVLSVRPDDRTITIEGADQAGLFYGVQTLLQHSGIDRLEGTEDIPPKVRVCGARIEDRPRFAWRGLMLDCSRTFLSMEYLRKYVDLLAAHKMNVLHLHLTDDAGWRIEIEQYPKLMEIGSKWHPRVKNDPDGYYTKKQMRALIEYARQRQITIVPEIEMPSHCLAVLAAYPELACKQENYFVVPFLEMYRPTEDRPAPPYGVFCGGNEQVFDFLENVLDEVIELFPSEYIHIGGDECPKTFWEHCPKCQKRMKDEGLENEEALQSYFIRRIEKMVNARGRKMIGWDEILQGGLAPNAAVMSWQSTEGGIAAARSGHDAVMAPLSHLYFDYAYSATPLSKTYAYEPVPEALSEQEAKHILGPHGCMWTHLARRESVIDANIFPRMCALGEVAWSPANKRDWADFQRRMMTHYQRLRAWKVDYYIKPELEAASQPAGN